jgi:hypothetical protein
MEPGKTEPAEERAARMLYEELERLDPSGNAPWGNLLEGERHLYRACIDAIAPILRGENV